MLKCTSSTLLLLDPAFNLHCGSGQMWGCHHVLHWWCTAWFPLPCTEGRTPSCTTPTPNPSALRRLGYPRPVARSCTLRTLPQKSHSCMCLTVVGMVAFLHGTRQALLAKSLTGTHPASSMHGQAHSRSLLGTRATFPASNPSAPASLAQLCTIQRLPSGHPCTYSGKGCLPGREYCTQTQTAQSCRVTGIPV